MDKPTGRVTRVEQEMMFDQLSEMLPMLLKKAAADAKLLKAKYDALLAVGFSEQQAMEIVTYRDLYE